MCAAPLAIGRVAGRRAPWSHTPSNLLRLSGWRRWVLGAAGVAVLAAFLGAFFQGAASPEVIDGRYFRSSHGDLAEIDRDEWLHLHTLESRIMAGHVMLFGLAGGLQLTQPASPDDHVGRRGRARPRSLGVRVGGRPQRRGRPVGG